MSPIPPPPSSRNSATECSSVATSASPAMTSTGVFNAFTSASQAIGYREVAEFLDGRIPTLAGALEKVRTRTNRLARAQETWLRSFPGMRFLDVPADEMPAVTAKRAWEELR